MTNNSIFTRVLSLVLCVIMFAGVLTSCFQMPEFKPTLGTHNHTTPNGGTTTKDHVDNEPTDDPIVPDEPVDPNELYSGSTTLANNDLIYGTLANDVFIGGEDGIAAMIPADVKVEAGASSLALSIKKVEDETLADTLSNLDVHISGIALDNTVPMTVMLGAILPAGLGLTELKLYHIENGNPVAMMRVNSVNDFAIHNQYVYDAETGNVTIYVSSFSVFTAVKSTASKWEDGTEADTSWYNDNDTEFTLEDVADFLGFRDLVDAGNTFEDKTVILGVDIDLANIPFDPIGFGYWYEKNVVEGKDQNTVFMGTFDGGNHTIYNLYENCWELDPDKTNYGTYTYSTAGAGLFASIKDATIKNIAICEAEVVFECVDMGVLVGYAQGECHFENIVITNANIANYNRYTGGLVGEVSYGVDNNGDGYSHTFKNITIDSTVTVSGLWGSFGCGMGGVIGGKWGEATVLMENVVSAPVMDVYNDVVSAYQWYAFRGCGMLIGHTEEPYSDGRHSGIATANFLTCQNVKVYYGEWVNYTYYEFENQDNATGRNYPWVRAEAGVYCDAFSNIRYGVPTHNGVKVSDLTEEELKAVATDYTPIIFNQLYGADRGMYGQEAHEGVTVIKTNTKTIYIENNLGWENLKLHYWYKHGDDTWTNHDADGIVLTEENGVYKVSLPAYAYAFKITADGDNVSKDILLNNLVDGLTYTLAGVHVEHKFVAGECVCGAYQEFNEYEFTLGDNGTGLYDGSEIDTETTYTADSYLLSFTSLTKVYGSARDALGNSCLKLGTGSVVGTFTFSVPEDISKVIIYVAGYKDKTITVKVNDISYDIDTLSNNGEYTAIEIDTTETKTITFETTSNGYRCMINTITFCTAETTIEVHDCEANATGATCTDNATCSVCGKEIADTAIGHNYESVVTHPTCIEDGYTTHTCANGCGSYYIDTKVDATGHNYVDGVCSCGKEEPTPITLKVPAGVDVVVWDDSGILPEAGAPDGYTFAGWSETTINETTICPTLWVAGDVYSGTATMLYAVYTFEKNTGSSTSYVLKDTISSGDTIVIAMKKSDGSIYIMPNNNGTGSAPSAISIIVSNGVISSNITDTHKWNVDVSDNSYTFYPDGTTETWLYCTSTNNGVRVGTNANKTFTLDGNYLKHSGTNRYLGVYNTQDWRCYTTNSGTSNIANQSVQFYVETTVAVAETYYVTICDHTNTTEEIVDPTCTVAGSTTVTCDACGETVSAEVIEATGHSFVNGKCNVCQEDDPDYEGGATEPEQVEATLSFANKAQRTSFSTTKQVWEQNGITFTNNKASSTNNVADYAGPVRLYANSEIVVEVTDKNITKIVFDCNSSSYATALKNSIGTVSGATVTVSSDKVTIEFSSAVDSFTIAKLTAQVRLDSITVTYTPNN